MPLGRDTRARLFAVLLLLLVLAAGFAMGFAVHRTVRAEDPAGEETEAFEGRSGREYPRGDEGDRRRGERDHRRLIVEQVGLSAEQKAKVDSIVAFHRERMEALSQEFQEAYAPRYRAVLEETRSSIKDVLTPEQRTAYDSLLNRWDRRWEERRQRDSTKDGRQR